MNSDKIDELKEEVNDWLLYNKHRGHVDLLDLSKLITILKRYYTMRVRSK